ncbi:MAG: oxalate/formate MFS antiporter, partial [Thermodesulfobacteriota bacterium]
PFAAKFKLPNVGWFGVFAVAVVFDWVSALLAQFVLKPLRMRYLAKQPAAAQAAVAAAGTTG